MQQQRQIVIKAVGKQMDTEDPAYKKYTITTLQSIVSVWISVFVTIYRIVPLLHRYQSSHCIMMRTAKLRSSI